MNILSFFKFIYLFFFFQDSQKDRNSLYNRRKFTTFPQISVDKMVSFKISNKYYRKGIIVHREGIDQYLCNCNLENLKRLNNKKFQQ